ncbi:MAG: glycosyltransferase family 4 protein [Cyanobacteriota bacterium]|nr:glycosyltransferase family 4 protein [Cyanobacteriota bacterium]
MTNNKILIYSPVFYPSIGGIESVVAALAKGLSIRDRAVKVVCQTPASDRKTFPFEVIRHPHPQQLLKLTRWCDIYFQACLSLKGLWPLFVAPKPLVATHQTWYRRLDGSLGVQDRLKLAISKGATNIAASRAIAQHLPAPATVIPNPYADDIFHLMPNIVRDRDLVFVGRWVSDKGVDLLIEALYRLKLRGLAPNLTLVGSGPEEPQLRQQVRERGLSQQVDFVGLRVGKDLASLLNACRILVVPSRWHEPFGIVALEGIACGCVAIGSEGGGLKEAIGPCGTTFPNGDGEALTQILSDLLSNPEKLAPYKVEAQPHLKRYQTSTIVEEYLQIIEAVVR